MRLLILMLTSAALFVGCANGNDKDTNNAKKMKEYFSKAAGVYRGMGANQGCGIKLEYFDPFVNLTFFDHCASGASTTAIIYKCATIDSDYTCDRIDQPSERVYFYGDSSEFFKFQNLEKDGHITDKEVYHKAPSQSTFATRLESTSTSSEIISCTNWLPAQWGTCAEWHNRSCTIWQAASFGACGQWSNDRCVQWMPPQWGTCARWFHGSCAAWQPPGNGVCSQWQDGDCLSWLPTNWGVCGTWDRGLPFD